MKKAFAIVVVAGTAGIASAQLIQASITTTANGGATAVIAPGGTVHIMSRVSWFPGGGNTTQFAGAQGGIIVTGNAGSGANFISEFATGPLVNLGAFIGGSRTGMVFGVTPAFFTGGFMIPPSGNHTGITLGEYDLTLPNPGVYTVNWVASAAVPNVRIFPSVSSPAFVEASSTYILAEITVIPSPASLALVGLGGLVATRRRR